MFLAMLCEQGENIFLLMNEISINNQTFFFFSYYQGVNLLEEVILEALKRHKRC